MDRIAPAVVAILAGLPAQGEVPAPGLFVACGATASGINAALRDLGGTVPACIESVSAFLEILPRLDQTRPLVGLSMSGGSAEVLDVLSRAEGLGLPTVYLTHDTGHRGPERRLQLRLEGLGSRFLPLAACLLVHHFSGSDAYKGLLAPSSSRDEEAWPGLLDFLEASFRGGLVPVFISGADPFPAAVLSSQYMEFLKRPSFHRSFPEWTHDLLWTLGPQDRERLAFVQLGPQEELSDRRAARVQERLEGLGIRCFSAAATAGTAGAGQGTPYPATSCLARGLALMADLAERLGLDPGLELGFS